MSGLRRLSRGLSAAVLCAGALCACSGSGSSRTAAPPAAGSHTAPTHSFAPPAVSELRAAEHPRPTEFPPPGGRSLKQLAGLIKGSVRLGASTQTFTIGTQRFAFALTDQANRFVYAPTALYIASSPGAQARGPFVAPADSLSVAHAYRSNENDGPGGLKAVYWTRMPFPRSGKFDVLALTRVRGHFVGSTSEVSVAASTPIPGVGQRPPDIATDTPASVHGKVSLLTTRNPPESMHSVSLDHVLGKRPVALLFSTPELCQSRVCGPVTDIVVSLQHEFGNRLAFIHQEIYVENQPTRGLRPQLKAFHLETEPWFFTVSRNGTIAARLEGVFGVKEARAALLAALRPAAHPRPSTAPSARSSPSARSPSGGVAPTP